LVNKYHNLSVAQGEIPETVRDHYKLLSHHASECIACGKCEKNCPFGVEIIEAMKKAVDLFGY
jgi:predicted aldo/keto reductase-like oxidoreductase